MDKRQKQPERLPNLRNQHRWNKTRYSPNQNNVFRNPRPRLPHPPSTVKNQRSPEHYASRDSLRHLITSQDFSGQKKTHEKPFSQPEQQTERKTQTAKTIEGYRKESQQSATAHQVTNRN
jgi:hypothetical protein